MEPDKKSLTEISPKNIESKSFFDNNREFTLFFKKTEKLASAIYMITSLFSDSEPMKWNLRKKVSDLLSFSLTYKDTPLPSRNDFIYTLKTRVLEVLSLLEVASRGGLVSTMNFSILKQEFTNLTDLFRTSNSENNLTRESLTEEFFYISQKQSETNKANLIEQTDLKDNEIIKDKGDFKRSNRQNIILNLLKKKKEVTIKDIAVVIKDCSEKTIQRELISFIAAGVLKRTGERRWSKYSLA